MGYFIDFVDDGTLAYFEPSPDVGSDTQTK
jgi:hypothetical protein